MAQSVKGGVGLDCKRQVFDGLFGKFFTLLLLYFFECRTLVLLKGCTMQVTQVMHVIQAGATVSSKGQVTLPAAMRAKLGLVAGSRIQFALRGTELVITPELPMSAYRGMLKPYNLNPADLEIPKERDREFL